jgi:GNAT superfamily N-acetyltransferase
MTDAILVRSAIAADFDQWLPLWEAYNSFYERSGPTALPSGITAATWDRLLDPEEPMHAIVATDGKRLMGIGHYLFHRSTIMLRMTCYLQDLFTDPAARGRGIGRLLIREVYERAEAAGSSRVYWHTRETNAVARALYDTVAQRSPLVVYRHNLYSTLLRQAA